MKPYIVFGAAVCAAAALLAQSGGITPMNVKTGEWEATTTITIQGGIAIPPDMLAKLPPAERARYEAAVKAQENAPARTHSITQKSCLTQADLSTNPLGQGLDQNARCKSTVVTSTGTDADLKIACTGYEGTMEYEMKIHATDTEHASGTGQGSVTAAGHTMSSSFSMTSHWLGATCPKGDGQ